RRQVVGDLPNMYAESRIHPIYRLKRQNCAGKREGSGGWLRGAGRRRAAWRAEVASPLPGAQAAVPQVRRGELYPSGFQGPERQFRRGEGNIPSGHGELCTAQRTFGVVESVPIKTRRLRLIEGRLQRPEMLPVMNPVPIKVCRYQQDVHRSAHPQPERQIGMWTEVGKSP